MGIEEKPRFGGRGPSKSCSRRNVPGQWLSPFISLAGVGAPGGPLGAEKTVTTGMPAPSPQATAQTKIQSPDWLCLSCLSYLKKKKRKKEKKFLQVEKSLCWIWEMLFLVTDKGNYLQSASSFSLISLLLCNSP